MQLLLASLKCLVLWMASRAPERQEGVLANVVRTVLDFARCRTHAHSAPGTKCREEQHYDTYNTWPIIQMQAEATLGSRHLALSIMDHP